MPSWVLRGSPYEQVAKGNIFLRGQSGSGKAYQTSRSASGLTSEAEAVLAEGTLLRRNPNIKTTYSEYKGEAFPIIAYEPVKTAELKSMTPTQIKQLKTVKQVKQEQQKIIKQYSNYARTESIIKPVPFSSVSSTSLSTSLVQASTGKSLPEVSSLSSVSYSSISPSSISSNSYSSSPTRSSISSSSSRDSSVGGNSYSSPLSSSGFSGISSSTLSRPSRISGGSSGFSRGGSSGSGSSGISEPVIVTPEGFGGIIKFNREDTKKEKKKKKPQAKRFRYTPEVLTVSFKTTQKLTKAQKQKISKTPLIRPIAV